MARAPRTAMALLLLAVGVVAPAATSTAADGACPDADGVTVVVDFRSLGGEMLVRCAVGDIDDGFHALREAGIDHDQPVRFPGMVCRIEDLPADEPCQGAPPADRYWGYWYAEHGDDWTYATKGPGGRTPPPGSAEGWAFFSTAAGDSEAAPPGMAPPTHPAPAASASPTPTPTPTPSPTPTPTPTPSPDPDAVSPSPPAPTPSTGPTEPRPPATPSDEPIEATSSPASTPTATSTPDVPSEVATPTPTPTSTATPNADPTEPTSPTVDDSPTPDDEPTTDPVAAPSSGGPSAATIAGMLLILALAVAAGVTARRRRTA